VDEDKKYMNIAIDLAKKSYGFSSPNPPVGCVIVEYDKHNNNGQIISVGNTQVAGRPHAEEKAISEMNFKKTKNYSCYTTLEPCNHKNQFQSCTERIIKSPIKKVIFSVKDPDKRTKGKGSLELKKAGIEVKSGILKKQTIDLYKGYFFRKMRMKPFVTLKIASSLDGKIGSKNDSIKWITNKSLRRLSHLLRFENDAILIGKNTAINDNPRLTCRISGLEKFSPKIILISESLKIPLALELFKKRNKDDIIIFTSCNDKNKLDLLKDVSTLIKLDGNKFNLTNILKKIAIMGISNLLVEGGSKINNFFLRNYNVDRLMIFRGNFFIGGNGIDSVNSSIEDLKIKKNLFKLKEIDTFEDNHLEVYENKNLNIFLKKVYEIY
tara:strand:+ start:5238 stop:6380 length:1143 start_codon:yes stop_codon:yes gene_type:complete